MTLAVVSTEHKIKYRKRILDMLTELVMRSQAGELTSLTVITTGKLRGIMMAGDVLSEGNVLRIHYEADKIRKTMIRNNI